MNLLAVIGIYAFFCGQIMVDADSIGDTVTVRPAVTVNQGVSSDPWLGQDKFMHFYGSAGICGGSFYFLKYRFDSDAGESAVYSVSITGLIGLGKEAYDRIRGRNFSMKDLVWDAAGIAAGYFIFVHQY